MSAQNIISGTSVRRVWELEGKRVADVAEPIESELAVQVEYDMDEQGE